MTTQEQIDLIHAQNSAKQAKIEEINALGCALSVLNESFNFMLKNSDQCNEFDNARSAIAKKLQKLAEEE